MPMEHTTSTTEPRRRWQFTLRSFFIVFVLIAVTFHSGTHFWRMTVRAREHQAEALRRHVFNERDFTYIPEQHWKANNMDLRWHEDKVRECLMARWFPWRQVNESNLPPVESIEAPFQPWTTPWRSVRGIGSQPNPIKTLD
jgi:hypothetical protein